MLVIGVTGGIASGKSFVAQELGRRGAAVIEADVVGHQVLELPNVRAALRSRWGASVFVQSAEAAGVTDSAAHEGRSDGSQVVGEVDRRAVARRVFAPPPDGPRELAFLEEVTHPLISERISGQLELWRRAGKVRAAVLDAPVLYKAGWDRYCDTIFFVDAPLEVRAARAAERGWSLEQLTARQEMQPSLAMQRDRADVVIDNGVNDSGPNDSGRSLAFVTEQIDRIWEALLTETKKND